MTLSDNSRRYLYSTSGGLLLSNITLNVGEDLSNVYSMTSGPYDGPNLLLLQDNGSSFALPAGESLLSLTVTRNTDTNDYVDGYKLLTKNASTDVVSEFSFALSGDLSSKNSLSNAELGAMEFDLKVDLTGDGVVGVNINSELFNKELDASGNWVTNSNERRWLYATSGGTLLSLNSLSVGGDLRNAYTMSSSAYDGPSFLLLKDYGGNDFSVPSGSSVEASRSSVKLTPLEATSSLVID